MTATPAVTFGDLLRRYRLTAGLTQEELAEKAQVSPRAISDLERGARNRPWREALQLLAAALHLKPAERAELEAAVRRGRRDVRRSGRSGGADPGDACVFPPRASASPAAG
jgi:transcriptional regulator with XRE-family HTH domain